jgi:hypothetical protein
MKSKILFVLFFGVNIFTYGQNKCVENLEQRIEAFAEKQHDKITIASTPEPVPGYNYHVSVEDLKDEETLSKNFKTLWAKGHFRFYLMSSKKFNNNAILKIYEGHTEDPDKLLYKLKDEANDNKPSYIDVDLNKSPGKFLLKFQFAEQNAGCVAFLSAVFKNHDYSFQKED